MINKNWSNSWMQEMSIKHCGKDYGSEFLNAYFFYRAVYHMVAVEAILNARMWVGKM